MKKILLLTAVLIGTATASQAGVRFSLGIPVPPAVVIVPPAPVYVQPPAVCAPTPVIVAPPVVQFGFGGYPRPYYHDYYHGYRAPYWHHDNHGRFHRW